MRALSRTRGAVIVTRVSSGTQLKGTSLEDQLDICRTKAVDLGMPIVSEYEDAGVSGAYLLLRSGMQQAIADIQEGRADTLICANLSRYSRDVEHQQQIRKWVRNAGGQVVFADFTFEDSPEGDLAFDIMGGFAAYERKVIRERTMRGKRKRAKEGQQPQRSRSPYGYHIVNRSDLLRGTYRPEELGHYHITEKADIVRWMFEGYADGTLSLPKICRELNLKGEPPPGGGRAWHEATVRVILSNPVYKGEPVSGRIKTYVDESLLLKAHPLTGLPRRSAEVRYIAPEEKWIQLSSPPIVAVDLWFTVQDRMRQMNGNGGGSPRQIRLLSGLVFCPACGERAVVKHQIAHKVTYRYYLCGAQRKARVRTAEKPCTGTLYPIDIVEEAALLALREAYEKPEAISAALQVYREKFRSGGPEPTMTDEVGAVDLALRQLRAEETAAIHAQIAGIRAGASPEAYAEVFADIASRRNDLEERRALLAKAAATADEGSTAHRADNRHIRQALEDANRVLSDPDVPALDKRNLIGLLVQKVIPNKEGADIFFVPGAFVDTGDEASRSTFYTTCIGINTQR